MGPGLVAQIIFGFRPGKVIIIKVTQNILVSLAIPFTQIKSYLISSFHRVLYVVCFLLGNYPKESIQKATCPQVMINIQKISNLHREMGMLLACVVNRP